MFKQHYGDNDSTVTKYQRWSVLQTLQFILVTPCISDEVGKNPNTHKKTETETNNKQQKISIATKNKTETFIAKTFTKNPTNTHKYP